MGQGKDWTLTLRHGPRVERLRFTQLDEGVAELERQLEAVRVEGRLAPAKMFRQYEPGERVHARGELSRGGFLRSVSAGVDLMGDGSLVAFEGSMRRRPLEVEDAASPYEAVRDALQ